MPGCSFDESYPFECSVQAMLINNADPMGGSFIPDGDRGFGRVLLRNMLPTNGEESTVLYVDDRAVIRAGQTMDYAITVSSRGVRAEAKSQ